ncbi:hypothetical protein [Enterovibrio baiacu]|uniref:hypothetical protein n=1 Tax=Enterovibrio baiacu TaxID=2491023 RepID=UPI001010F994|nr:hypothetical protein [Enterovibrio baiacu]MBE1275839.1 hypothetical protein [Enterovibrio baiacu]
MDKQYNQAVDVLAQLRVGDAISDALRADAKEVTKEVFEKHCQHYDLNEIDEMLHSDAVCTTLRNTWTDMICDVWHS